MKSESDFQNAWGTKHTGLENTSGIIAPKINIGDESCKKFLIL